MAALRACPQCGAELPGDAPRGLCPACLFRIGTTVVLGDAPGSVRVDQPSPGFGTAGARPPQLGYFGNYELLEEIARGGMGAVYKARQLNVNRLVALKMITAGKLASPELVERFRTEAEAAAQLDHPNIVPIYEVGEHDGLPYFSMKLVEGGDLAQRIQDRRGVGGVEWVRRAARLIAKVARAVHYAHERGILHRDLKPGNILLDSSGQPYVTDFGLAKLMEKDTSLTQSMMVMGTASYMAPEQAAGKSKHLTPAADVYSLGVILYEMITGQPPFRAETPVEIMRQVLEHEPEKPSARNAALDRDLDTICLKCLEKEPYRRYRSAEALAQDLERWLAGEPIQARPVAAWERAAKWGRRNFTRALTSAATALIMGLIVFFWVRTDRAPNLAPQKLDRSRIVVLPFANLSSDKENEYFAQQMTDQLVTRLVNIGGLTVFPANTTNYTGADLAQRLRELNVGTVLRGSVSKAGDQISINTQLVDMRGGVLWATNFEKKFEAVFDVQRDFAQSVAEGLQIQLAPAEKLELARNPTEDPEAYALFLQGRHEWNKLTKASLSNSIDFYKKAVAKDPKYALAYCGLADSYTILGVDQIRPSDVAPQAKAWARRALELDETLAEAHLSMGMHLLFYAWDWAGAGKELALAVKLKPRHADAHHYYGHYLESQRRTNEALIQWQRAWQLDPLRPVINTELGLTHYFSGHWDEAIKYCHRALGLDSNLLLAYLTMAQAFAQKGDYAAALNALTEASTRPEGAAYQAIVAERGCAHAGLGQTIEAKERLNELLEREKQEWIDPYFMAIIHLSLGDKPQALEWLKKAFAAKSGMLVWVNVDPRFKSLRDEAGFIKLIQDMKFGQ